MMGLLVTLVMAVAVLGLMRLSGLKGAPLTLAAAAMAFGGAGYALDGQPSLPGSPIAAATRAPPISLAEPRAALMGQFTAADRWLIIADSYAQRGATADAVGVLRAAIREHPTDYALWVGLGNALTDHTRGLTPAGRYAFAEAARLQPTLPAPTFFLGLAEARSGNPKEAVRLWDELLARSPADVSWRPMVEDLRLAVAGGARPPAPQAS